MSVAGTYDCVIKSPMGDQKGKFTVNVDGDGFTGSVTSPMGSMDVLDGQVSGNTLTWQMKMTVPMTGAVKAGAFGSMAMSGTREV